MALALMEEHRQRWLGDRSLGENPVGYIFYNHDGYMSVEIMAAHRVPTTTRTRSVAPRRSDRRRSAPTSPTRDRSKCSPTRAPSSTTSRSIGNAQVRSASLEANVLTLRTKPMIFQGVERRAEVVWERVGHD
jgi:hypothetical protein